MKQDRGYKSERHYGLGEQDSPHLQRQADERYRRYEMHNVQKAYTGSRWGFWQWAALVVVFLLGASPFISLLIYAISRG